MAAPTGACRRLKECGTESRMLEWGMERDYEYTRKRHLIDIKKPKEIGSAAAKKASEKLLQMGVSNVIITLGDKGAYFANNEENFHNLILNLSTI